MISKTVQGHADINLRYKTQIKNHSRYSYVLHGVEEASKIEQLKLYIVVIRKFLQFKNCERETEVEQITPRALLFKMIIFL